jgi:hypothetical protein
MHHIQLDVKWEVTVMQVPNAASDQRSQIRVLLTFKMPKQTALQIDS